MKAGSRIWECEAKTFCAALFPSILDPKLVASLTPGTCSD